MVYSIINNRKEDVIIKNLLILSPLILLLIFSLVLNKRKYNLNDYLKIIICGFLSLLITIIFGNIINSTIENFAYSLPLSESIQKFISFLFLAGLLEETSKWLCIKFTKPNDEYSIYINSILISIIFTVFENFFYINKYNTIEMLIGRSTMIGHLVFQIIMSLLLIKALKCKKNDKKGLNIIFQFLSIIIPAFVHALYNTIADNINIYEISLIVFIIIGIIIYTSIIIIGIIINKKDSIKYEKRKLKKVRAIIEIIFILLLSIFFIKSSDNTVEFNHFQKIESSGIEMRIIAVEEIEVNDDIIESYNGKYLKISIEIKNETNNDFEIVSWDFSLENINQNIPVIPYSILNDVWITEEISKMSTATKNIYFKTNYQNDFILKYSVGLIDPDVYKFSLKK